MTTRRDFLRSGAKFGVAAALAPVVGLAAQQAAPGAAQEPLAGGGEVGELRDPGAAGRARTPTASHDNDEAIKQVELRLACPCPCTLDIFTCRTTDFTCTYSPEAHREIVALFEAGKTPQEVIDTFVARYGEQALMAPKAEGFNLAGYLVPGVAITAAGGVLAWLIARRRNVAASAVAPADTSPAAAAPAPSSPDAAPPAATPEEMERLRQALAEVED